MIAAFFHDTQIYREGLEKFYSQGFSYSIWKRYLGVFSELIISTRCQDISEAIKEQKNGLQLSSGHNVRFNPILSYRSLQDIPQNYSRITKEIRDSLIYADCAIIRLPSVIGMLACQEAIRLKKPWAVEVVSCALDVFWNYGSASGKIAAPIYSFLTKHYVKKASYCIYVTESFLQKRYPSLAEQTNCSNVEILMSEPEVLEKRLNRINSLDNSKQLVFGMIGNLGVAYKGYDTALHALSSIRCKLPDFKLRILGGGDNSSVKASTIKLALSNNVEFSGTLPSGEPVLRWLDDIDVFLMPSYTEGLPRSLIEAMSRGCPAIGSEAGGIPELLDTLCLHKSKDYQDLGDKILHLVSDKNIMLEQASRNFTRSQEYDCSILNKRRTEFWRSFHDYAASKKTNSY